MDGTLLIGLLSGIGGAVVAGVVAFVVAYFTAHRSGSQKIAESRMAWNELHRKLSVELHWVFARLSRPNQPVLLADQEAAIKLATEILLIINPQGAGDSAKAEAAVQTDLLQRLASLNLKVDMQFIALHRSVLKHAWRTAKSEF